MHSFEFYTTSPYNEAARTLDMMRRLSFELKVLNVQTLEGSLFRIRVQCSNQNPAKLALLDRSIAKMPGIFNFTSYKSRLERDSFTLAL